MHTIWQYSSSRNIKVHFLASYVWGEDIRVIQNSRNVDKILQLSSGDYNHHNQHSGRGISISWYNLFGSHCIQQGIVKFIERIKILLYIVMFILDVAEISTMGPRPISIRIFSWLRSFQMLNFAYSNIFTHWISMVHMIKFNKNRIKKKIKSQSLRELHYPCEYMVNIFLSTQLAFWSNKRNAFRSDTNSMSLPLGNWCARTSTFTYHIISFSTKIKKTVLLASPSTN